jgi:hypothetical protein
VVLSYCCSIRQEALSKTVTIPRQVSGPRFELLSPAYEARILTTVLRYLVNSVVIQIKKSEQSRYTPRWRLGERKCSSYSFTTSSLDGGEWSASRLGRALPQGKDPLVSIVQEAGWTPELVWTHRLEEKSFAPAGDRTQIARSSSPKSDTILTELPRLLLILKACLKFYPV